MLQKTTDRVLICLPDGRWLALSADLFREALRSGAELATSAAGPAAPQAPSALATADEIGEATHMSRATVYELAKAGVLPCVRVGRRIRFDRQKVMTVLASQSTANLPHDSGRASAALAGIEMQSQRGRITFHSLRHAAATAASASRANVQTASSLLGHANPQITLTTYADEWATRLDQATAIDIAGVVFLVAKW